MARITCPCCGETDALAYSNNGCCWECGTKLQSATFTAPVSKKSDEEKAAEVDAAASKLAADIMKVAIKKVATVDTHTMIAIVKDTCRAKGSLFATKFTALMIADERFAAVVRIMSPAQTDGRW